MEDLVITDQGQKAEIARIASATAARIAENVLTKIEAQIGPRLSTQKLNEVYYRVRHIGGVVEEAKEGPATINPTYFPYLKMAVLEERFLLAKQVDEQRQKVSSAEVMTQLDARLKKYDWLLNADWFRVTTAVRVPHLSDVLTIESAEAAMGGSGSPARQYDEKFHILQAPTLFRPDLESFRNTCGMRDVSVSVAFMDIDDFKKFNTDFTYPVIDLHFLPRFMAALEAHVYGRGFGYRFGGDEYVVTFPNADTDDAVRVLRAFQKKLEGMEFVVINRKPTVSVGIFEVQPTCYLTNGEIFTRAEVAKDLAKRQRKGSIAAYPVNQAEPVLMEGH